MLTRERLDPAVRLQAKGWQLLRWLENAFDQGFVTPEGVHRYATLEGSALAWLDRHWSSLPKAAQPSREELVPFSKLFSTYLVNTFDLEASPGERLYSEKAHCFCPMCSWMVKAPHLQPKKLSQAHKRRAAHMRRNFLLELAARKGALLQEDRAEALVEAPEWREASALCAYASDLLDRLEGIAAGPASLALWRTFAWTPEGSPRKDFTLTTDLILAAQAALAAEIDRMAPGS